MTQGLVSPTTPGAAREPRGGAGPRLSAGPAPRRGGFGEVWSAEGPGGIPRRPEDHPPGGARGRPRTSGALEIARDDPAPEPARGVRGLDRRRAADPRHGAGRRLALGPIPRGLGRRPRRHPPRGAGRGPDRGGQGDRLPQRAPPRRRRPHGPGHPASRPQAAEHPPRRRRREGRRLRRGAVDGGVGHRPHRPPVDPRLRGPRVLPGGDLAVFRPVQPGRHLLPPPDRPAAVHRRPGLRDGRPPDARARPVDARRGRAPGRRPRPGEAPRGPLAELPGLRRVAPLVRLGRAPAADVARPGREGVPGLAPAHARLPRRGRPRPDLRHGRPPADRRPRRLALGRLVLRAARPGRRVDRRPPAARGPDDRPRRRRPRGTAPRGADPVRRRRHAVALAAFLVMGGLALWASGLVRSTPARRPTPTAHARRAGRPRPPGPAASPALPEPSSRPPADRSSRRRPSPS